jgi:hypothetical protein
MRGEIQDKSKRRKDKVKEILRKLAVERRDDLANRLGASGRRNDIVVDTTPATPVLVRRAVNGLLSCSG